MPSIEPAFPTSTPTESSSDMPSVSSSFSPSTLTCTGDEVMLEFTLTTDDFPQETDWQILRTEDGALMLNGGPYSESATSYEYKQCVRNSCHMLVLYDSWGDGLMNGSTYTVKMEGLEKVTTESFTGTWKNVMFNC
jgi:hypothetical protein